MVRRGAVAALVLLAASAQAQQPQIGIKPVELTQSSYTFDTAEQHGIKVSVLAKGFARPFAIEFLPDGDLLIVERGAGLRILHGATGPNPQLDAALVPGVPRPADAPFSLGSRT
jgi:glucose/arabinose dehydrogenase